MRAQDETVADPEIYMDYYKHSINAVFVKVSEHYNPTDRSRVYRAAVTLHPAPYVDRTINLCELRACATSVADGRGLGSDFRGRGRPGPASRSDPPPRARARRLHRRLHRYQRLRVETFDLVERSRGGVISRPRSSGLRFLCSAWYECCM